MDIFYDDEIEKWWENEDNTEEWWDSLDENEQKDWGDCIEYFMDR